MNGVEPYGAIEMEYIRRYHRHEPKENQSTSALVKHIRAPVHLVSCISIWTETWPFWILFLNFFFWTGIWLVGVICVHLEGLWLLGFVNSVEDLSNFVHLGVSFYHSNGFLASGSISHGIFFPVFCVGFASSLARKNFILDHGFQFLRFRLFWNSCESWISSWVSVNLRFHCYSDMIGGCEISFDEGFLILPIGFM